MIDQLTPQRDEGIMIHGDKLFDKKFDYAAAVSNGDQNDSTIDNNNHKDFNGRLVFHPLNGPCDDLLTHLSFGVSGGVGVENESVSPSVLTTPATVEFFSFNNGVLANGVRYRLSPELTYFYHSLGFAAQYYEQQQELQVSAGRPTVDVPIRGYYFMTSYFLTGEHRTDYSEQIDPIRPFSPSAPGCETGALEILGRVSQLNVGEEAFIDHLATPGISALDCTETTLGLNWYLNKWVRAQFNYEHAWFKEPMQIGNAPKPLKEEEAFYTRLQLTF
jgi:phosphate-selective porin OprO/OprP